MGEILARNKACNIYFQEKQWAQISPEAVNFVIALTEKRPDMRLTAEEALEHPWFQSKLPSAFPMSAPALAAVSAAVFPKVPKARDRGMSAELMNRMKGGEREGSVLEIYTQAGRGSAQEEKASDERQLTRTQMVLRELRIAEGGLKPASEQSQV